MNGRGGPASEKNAEKRSSVMSVWGELRSVSAESHVESAKLLGHSRGSPSGPSSPAFLLLLLLVTCLGRKT